MSNCCRPIHGICEQCGHPVRGKRYCTKGPMADRARVPKSSQKLPNLPKHSRKAPRLGDRIESALTAVGITKERWAAFVGEEGLPPGCSACDKRQAKLNAADEWMRAAAAKLGEKAAEAISAIWRPIRHQSPRI